MSYMPEGAGVAGIAGAAGTMSVPVAAFDAVREVS